MHACLCVRACACVVCVSFVLYNLDYLICKIIMNVLLLLVAAALLPLLLLVLFLFPFFLPVTSFVSFTPLFFSYSIHSYSVSFFFLLILVFQFSLEFTFFRQFINVRTKLYKVIYVWVEIAHWTYTNPPKALHFVVCSSNDLISGVLFLVLMASNRNKMKNTFKLYNETSTIHHGFE